MRLWRRLVLLSLLGFSQVVAAAPPSADAEAERLATEWLGPRSAATPDVQIRLPFWQGPGSLYAEQRVAQRTIRGWWPTQLADPDAGEILDGFSWYLQATVIEHVFDLRYLRPGHSVDARPYFGDHVIWSFPPLRLSRHAAAERNRYAAVFAALERWLGVPTLQGAMFEVARLPADRLTAELIVKTISDAAGQDLTWAFAAAAPGVEMNYAITALSSAKASGCATPCVDTTVAVAREGSGIFPGSSAERTGDFEAGDALGLTVTFADRSESSIRWDGRDRARTFQFRGATGATGAFLDPDGIVTLDSNRLDNAMVTPAPTNVPVHKWIARWLVWLQHTTLSYGFLS